MHSAETSACASLGDLSAISSLAPLDPLPSSCRHHGGVQVERSLLKTYGYGPSGVEGADCILYPLTTVGELLLLAHTDGTTVLTCGPPLVKGRRITPERRAQYLIRTVFQLVATLIFPVGWVGDPRLQVFAAPLPFSPPPETIVRTGKRRRALQKVKPGLYFMMLAALVGEATYDVAATAFARAASFRRTFSAVAEASLAGKVLSQAARFRFGARELTSLANQGTEFHRVRAGLSGSDHS